MKLNIKDRLVIIVGPSTTGKSTLARKINREFNYISTIISYDEITKKNNKKSSQKTDDDIFRTQLLEQISDAINNESNELIILDSTNYDAEELFSTLYTIRTWLNYRDGITLIKMDLPLELHEEYIQKRFGNKSSDYYPDILQQRDHYTSLEGSLNNSYDILTNNEFIIENPEGLKIKFKMTGKNI